MNLFILRSLQRLIPLYGLTFLTAALSFGQTVVINDDFLVSRGTTYTTTGAIGPTNWQVTRSGADWGARIHENQLMLTNDATTAANEIGWVFASQNVAATGDFNPILSQSNGLVTWTFNMRQPRLDPGGFVSGSYGVGFVLGATSNNVRTSGSGYAVVLGNPGSVNPVRLISFTEGLRPSTGTNVDLITAGSPLNNPDNNFLSIQVTYDPATNEWIMAGRNDGSTAFQDPNTGTLTTLGTVVNSTHTNSNLSHVGAYWQGNTAANQRAWFDNVSLTAIPEPSTYAIIFLFAALAGMMVRRWGKGKVAG